VKEKKNKGIEAPNPEIIAKMFSDIAERYDLANRLMSLGMDLYWRKKAARLTCHKDAKSLLDMCCGTADFAMAFVKTHRVLENITCCDLSEQMLGFAEKKLSSQYKIFKANQNNSVFQANKNVLRFLQADCTALDLPHSSFDIICCGFGIRNTNQPQKVIAEMHRLLKPNGKVCILEFTVPNSWALELLFRAYLLWIIPLIGGIVTMRFHAYKYLTKSIITWNENFDIKRLLVNAGFADVCDNRLAFGSATVFTARKE